MCGNCNQHASVSIRVDLPLPLSPMKKVTGVLSAIRSANLMEFTLNGNGLVRGIFIENSIMKGIGKITSFCPG